MDTRRFLNPSSWDALKWRTAKEPDEPGRRIGDNTLRQQTFAGNGWAYARRQPFPAGVGGVGYPTACEMHKQTILNPPARSSRDCHRQIVL